METYFVGERNKIAEGIHRFLGQPEIRRTVTVSLVDLIHMQFLDFA